MKDKTSLTDILNGTVPKPRTEPKLMEEPGEEDLGPCAAIAKNRWITALTIKHVGKPWDSFQYRHIGVHSTFEPTRFEVFFVGDDEKWRIAVTGRNLEKIYNLVIQGRMEWIRKADRDFADDRQPIITGIVVDLVQG